MGSIKGNSISSEHNTLPDRAITLKDSGNLNAFLLLGRAHSGLGVGAWCVNQWAYLFMCCISSNKWSTVELTVTIPRKTMTIYAILENLTDRGRPRNWWPIFVIQFCFYSVFFLWGMSSLGWILYNFIMSVIFEYLKVSDFFLPFEHRSKGILICLKVCAVSKQ